jgi:hypothetical protein
MLDINIKNLIDLCGEDSVFDAEVTRLQKSHKALKIRYVERFYRGQINEIAQIAIDNLVLWCSNSHFEITSAESLIREIMIEDDIQIFFEKYGTDKEIRKVMIFYRAEIIARICATI